MTTFQFDKCFDDVEIIDACNDAKLAVARRLDEELAKAKDPQLLQVLMKRQTPIVTIDRALPWDHCAHIPEVNPGVIVIAYSRYIDRSKETLRTMTTKAGGRILKAFKLRFPAWHQTAVANSVVEITNKGVEVFHVDNGILVRDVYIEFGDDMQLQQDLTAVLRSNSQRHTPPPPPDTQSPCHTCS